ncbi:hypothetical protein [Cribrihabitans neustonicus]|uniref:hypothetical protein n=1 Tax=Cribrihabitans neustonicus TaxID=1429085 RepID=UPI003B5A7780
MRRAFSPLSPACARRLLPAFCLAAAAALTACGAATEGRATYDGVAFRAKAKPVDKKVSRAAFQVTIKNAGRSLKGARLAAAHAGTSYCVMNYGSSRIDWQADPWDEGAPLALSGSDAIFWGTCDP